MLFLLLLLLLFKLLLLFLSILICLLLFLLLLLLTFLLLSQFYSYLSTFFRSNSCSSYYYFWCYYYYYSYSYLCSYSDYFLNFNNLDQDWSYIKKNTNVEKYHMVLFHIGTFTIRLICGPSVTTQYQLRLCENVLCL